MAEVAGYVQEHGIQLVVVDTWLEWTGLREREDSAGSTNTALAPVKALADLGVAVLIVHRERKAHGNAVEMARGSGAITAAVDVILKLKKEKGGIRTLIGEYSRFDETPDDLSGELVDLDYIVVSKVAVETATYAMSTTRGPAWW